jgi:Domain of unknown function (DUF1906)
MRALMAGLLGALVLTPPPAHADATTTVDYQGLRITVPAGWPVYRMGPTSRECVRFDRHAVYLGSAAPAQLCPAHAAGRTEAIHVEPLTEQTRTFVSGILDGPLGPRMARTYAGGLPGLRVRDPGTREIRVALPGADAMITGSYGADERAAERVLGGVVPAPADRHSAERRSGLPVRHRWVTGAGFDTCEAPSLPAMRAWREDFVAANVYIGGPARACPNRLLSRAWVSAVRDMGWRLMPTYVGPQAPCSRYETRFSRDNAAWAGRWSARDAVRRARALGLPRRTPIYFDLEAYRRRVPRCRRAVLRFLDAWTKGVRARRYVSGVYSSLGSGIADLGRATGISKPSTIWFAHWDDSGDVRGEDLPEDWWPGHRRIKQYRGGHVEKHGGFRLAIDSDAVDGYVR